MGKEEGGHYCHIPFMRMKRDDGGLLATTSSIGSRISEKKSILNLNYNLIKCDQFLERKGWNTENYLYLFCFFPLDVPTDSALDVFINFFSFKKYTPLIFKRKRFYTMPEIWRIF